jgi:nitrite reductase (NO-forming)
MTAQPDTPTRRSFLEKALIGSGVVATGVIVGSAYEAIQGSGTPPPTVLASEPTPVPGPQVSGQVTNPYPAALKPVGTETTKQLTLEARDATVEIGAGVKFNAWTFDGTVPAPVVHVRQGDTVDFTLKNSGSSGHSIDFHAAQTPWDVNYKTILPGETLSFKWTADLPGTFLYHCGTAPVLHHIGNGMYGAIVVDPDTPLEPAREYVLLQSEFYAKPAADGTWDGDLDKMKAARPDLLAFNGSAFQYRDNPLPATVGERIRLYVVNAGPTLFSAFHVIGALFDKVLIDGNPANVLRGVQTYTVPPGGASTFELIIPNAGKYPFVTHSFAYTELGAVGLLQVT